MSYHVPRSSAGGVRAPGRKSMDESSARPDADDHPGTLTDSSGRDGARGPMVHASPWRPILRSRPNPTLELHQHGVRRLPYNPPQLLAPPPRLLRLTYRRAKAEHWLYDLATLPVVDTVWNPTQPSTQLPLRYLVVLQDACLRIMSSTLNVAPVAAAWRRYPIPLWLHAWRERIKVPEPVLLIWQ